MARPPRPEQVELIGQRELPIGAGALVLVVEAPPGAGKSHVATI